ncbi:helix-turn-helix domain-containing protein [Sphingomonas sp. CGMCC 1.13654]|uniref:Helix-turn-helix domain-containing protein n=1 Tax=Sphingomonas chungangi TaxID=2683589 RepID=A0A838L8D2_9SPHN|nr:helix-turn-helix domain-containing protein [Sphingomonas chungangi]MBA2934809.1 helix-turn-helix domain-containing protein [Sphingomonas chungangi]MVW58120.1 helix-turn-helix domain-containing protein [Sphingomonas chungangi]
MKQDQELRSLKRGLKVLTLLNQVNTLGITELARHLELPRTTAERILMTLAAEGYVERIPDDRRFRLSAKVTTLARGFSDDCWIVHIATPLLFEVTRRIGWPLGIATQVGDTMVLRTTTDPATSLWLNRRRIGAETPILASSSGLVAYAFAADAERDRLLDTLRTSRHAINRDRSRNAHLFMSLTRPVMEKGYAIQPPPNDMPERSISVPIMIGGKLAAVLLLMYMPRALSNSAALRDYLPLLRDLSEEISTRVADREDWAELDEDDAVGNFIVPPAASRFGATEVRYA